MKKNILVLTSTYPRWKNDTEPAFVHKLCQELCLTYNVHVLTPHTNGSKTYENMGGIQVHRYRYAPIRFQKLAYNGGILENLKRNPFFYCLIPFFLLSQLYYLFFLHRKYKFTLLHAHWIIPQGLVAIIFKKFIFPSLPVMVTSHGADLFALNGKLLTILKSWILRNSNKITVVSQAMKQFCTEDMAIEENKVTVRSMGVDLVNTFTPPNPEAPHQRDGLIFVGRLVEKKGIEHLIQAISDIQDQGIRIRLSIVGNGPLRQHLETMSAQLGLKENITFLGSVVNSEIPKLLRKASIAVMPSVIARSGDQEGLGLSAVEAMGCGCAIVASDLPAIRDIILHGHTGLLAEHSNPFALKKAIIYLLENPSLRSSLSINGRDYVLKHFDWKAVGKEYADEIGSLVKL